MSEETNTLFEAETSIGHDALQQKVYSYIWNTYPRARRCFWHTPNELKPDTFVQWCISEELKKDNSKFVPKWIFAILKQWQQRFRIHLSHRQSIGVLKGVTDLVFYWKGILYMFDVKLGSDKLSEAQKSFIAANTAQGGVFLEIYSFDQAKQYIDSILS